MNSLHPMGRSSLRSLSNAPLINSKALLPALARRRKVRMMRRKSQKLVWRWRTTACCLLVVMMMMRKTSLTGIQASDWVRLSWTASCKDQSALLKICISLCVCVCVCKIDVCEIGQIHAVYLLYNFVKHMSLLEHLQQQIGSNNIWFLLHNHNCH